MDQGERTADVLIEEVRERRRRLFEEHGFDLMRLLAVIRRRQAERPQEYVDHRQRRKAR